jgi:hypothetical protein
MVSIPWRPIQLQERCFPSRAEAQIKARMAAAVPADWMALLARSSASKDAGLLVLRNEPLVDRMRASVRIRRAGHHHHHQPRTVMRSMGLVRHAHGTVPPHSFQWVVSAVGLRLVGPNLPLG